MPRKQQSKRREHFGQIDKQRSGRYRARYLDPTDKTRFISAPATCETIGAARDWLTQRKAEEDGQAGFEHGGTPVEVEGRSWLMGEP